MYRGGGNNRYRSRGNYSGRGRGNGRQTTRQRGLFADGIWHCDCTPRLPAEHFKTRKEGPNQGRWFYTCQKPKGEGCGFFLWDDDAKPREEAAVLSGKRSEPGGETAQEGWNAGRPTVEPQGKGLFEGHADETARYERDASTASPTPPPSRKSNGPSTGGSKRTARDAELDEFDLDDVGARDMEKLANSLPPETPHKIQKTGVYATPATTGKRKLPWLEEPVTPATSTKSTTGYFDTPSKGETQSSISVAEPETPAVPHTIATAASPSPPTRYKDALHNPADSASSLTSEVLAALSSVTMPAEVRESLRSICTKHDLRSQGFVRGRDISRLAIKAKDAKITELQARIASMQADNEVEKSLNRMKRWQSEGRLE
ncbi:uncharacterized protein LTR77_001425 [Saxophila tyrrhenica]|uniref:GRF-type domain-containing protein n=1 Tax=Saxophila tyrrhenica TaxID=1690608 RepID=A0AAV9PKS7_9PEZI|nr:hypothetical protein LTR77_001425 [Saxophila tyrrhenica]